MYLYSREREMRRHRRRFPKRLAMIYEATLLMAIDFKASRVVTGAGRGGSFEWAFGLGSDMNRD
jgi:hypothetical protein